MGKPFNAELARQVLGILDRIEAEGPVNTQVEDMTVSADWKQSTWRDLSVSEGNSCKTAMCFAGWTAQVQGAWMMSESVLGRMNPATVRWLNNGTPDYVAVPLDSVPGRPLGTIAEWVDYYSSHYGMPDPESTALALKHQHGELEQMAYQPVSRWAADELGLGDDPLGLFDEGHSLADLHFIIDFYTKYGTSEEAYLKHAPEVEHYQFSTRDEDDEDEE